MKRDLKIGENNKLVIRNADKSFTKHEIVKLLVMIISRRKHKDALIGSEIDLENGEKIDVLVQTKKEKIYYEVQKEITNKWNNRIYSRDILLDMNTVVIPLKKMPDNIEELEIEVEKYVV